MRPLCISAAVLATMAAVTACAPADDAADTTAVTMQAASPPIVLADLAGTWEGRSMPMGRDTVVVTFELMATGTRDGWTMKLPNGTVPMRVVVVDGDSLVTEAGPYASALQRNQQVTVRNVSRLRDGMMVGTTHARYSNGDTVSFRIQMTRKASATQAPATKTP